MYSIINDYKYVIIAVVLLLLSLVYRKIKVYRFMKAHGCKEPYYFVKDPFGFRILFQALKQKNEGRLAEFSLTLLNGRYTGRFDVLGLVPIIITKDPENLKAMLATQFNEFALGTRHKHFYPLLGDGIFTLDAQGWKDSRSLLRPQFSREQVAHVKSLEPHIRLLEKHFKKTEGKPFDIQDFFFKFTMDTATEFLFGESVDTLKDTSIGESAGIDFEERLQFAEAFNTSQTYLSSRTYLQVFYFLVNSKRFRDSNKVVHRFTDFFVNKALSTPENELEEKSKGGYTFLYELARQSRNPRVLRDQALNILLAGRDTTAGLLSFTFFELARNPDVWNKLRAAVINDFGTGTPEDIEAITFETLKKCEYLKFVINEVLRMYPSVPNNFRVALKETTLPKGGGPDGQSPIHIPKGSSVAYSVYSTHRIEEFYGKDALEFKPERWEYLNKLGWAYLPFNGGPRICLGQQFALTEASYCVVRLCQLFSKIESHDHEYPPRKNIQLTMNMKLGVNISLYN